MNRLWRHVTSLAIVSGMGAAPGCAHDDQTLVLRAVLAPPDDCIYTPDSTRPFLPTGIVDLGLRSEYSPTVLMMNQMVTRGDPAQARAESNRIVIEGAEVRVTFPGGATVSEFTSLTSGFVEPSSGTTPGFGVTGITIIDPPTAQKLREQLPNRSARRTVVAYVKVFGHSLGGRAIESNEFQFPVTSCFGCLVSFPAEANDTSVPRDQQPNCNAASTGSGGAGGNTKICAIGQDQAVDCRECRNYQVCDPRGIPQ